MPDTGHIVIGESAAFERGSTASRSAAGRRFVADLAPRKATISAPVAGGLIKALDFCLIIAAAATTFNIYLKAILGDPSNLARYALTSVIGAALFVLGFHLIDGYSLRKLGMVRWQASRIAAIWLGTLAVLVCVAFLGKVSTNYSRAWTMGWFAGSASLLLLSRLSLYFMMRHWSHQGLLRRHVAIVGANDNAATLIANLAGQSDEDVWIVGVFDDRLTRVPTEIGNCKVLGTTDDLLEFSRSANVDEIIVTLPLHAEDRIADLLHKFRSSTADVRLSSPLLSQTLPVNGITRRGEVTLLNVVDRPLKNWHGVAKWIEDKLIGFIALALLSPLMLLIALAIKLDSPGPVFFRQERFGLNNAVIRVLKFRTMYRDAGDRSGAQRTIKNDPRVTRVGRVLRKLSLDELPQLINVVRGEMSIVGPRPHAIAMKAGDRLYHEAVSDYACRHRIKPGLTGWAQVNGLRGEINSMERAEQRIRFDLDYIERWSIPLDLRILLRTVVIVLKAEDAY